MSKALATLLGRRNPLRRRRTSGVGPRLTYPDIPLGIRIALALGADPAANPSTWTWTDITDYVMYGDEGGIIIRRGRADEQTQTPPSWCRLQVNNADGRFSRLNPTGAYYGQLRKNTPLRVQVNPGTGWATRFVGFVSEWPPRWTHGGLHHWVPIQADGVLRRLGQGSAPIKSLAKSAAQYAAENIYDVVGYWPMEDATGATQAASGLLSGKPLTVINGTVEFDDVAPPAGSAAAPALSAGSLAGTCARSAAGTSWSVVFFVNCTGTCTVLSWQTTGSVTSWTLAISTTTVTLTPSTGSAVTFSANYADGEWHCIRARVSDSGADVSINLDGDTSDSGNGIIFSATCGRVTDITVNPGTDADLVSVGHLTVNGTSAAFISSTIMNGQPGVAAGGVFDAIGTYNGVVVDVSSENAFSDDTMGAFPVGTMLNAFQQCADVAGGALTERFDGRLGLDSHLDRENLPIALALDHDRGHVVAPFEPTDDDLLTRNDVTVTRDGGSSARVTDEDSIAAVGRYDDQLTLNLYLDGQAVHHAGWRVHLGTVDEYRYPTVALQLRKSSDLVRAWLACDVGSRVAVANLPAGVAADVVDQIIEGYTEHISSVAWAVAPDLSPYAPWQVNVLAEDDPGGDAPAVGWLEFDTCELAAGVDDNDTSWSVTCDPDDTSDADEFPRRHRIGGELITVTASTGGASPTWTVTRSGNGVVKSHSSGAEIVLADPLIMTLP